MKSLPKSGLIALTVFFFALQLFAVILRITCRKIDRINLAVDDYLVLAASIIYFGFYFVPVLIGLIRGSVGEHMISPDGKIIPPNHTSIATQLLFVPSHSVIVGCARLSIVCLYRRIFVGKSIKTITFTLNVLQIIWIASGFFANFVGFFYHCYPDGRIVAGLYDPGPFCMNFSLLNKTLGVAAICFDLTILALPWPWVMKLQMQRPQKLDLSLIFAFGNLTLATSIARCYSLFWTFDQLEAGDMDITYFDGINLIWAQLEAAISIVCACMFAFGKLALKGDVLARKLRSVYIGLRYKQQSTFDSVSESSNDKTLDRSHSIEPKLEFDNRDSVSAPSEMVIRREISFGIERV